MTDLVGKNPGATFGDLITTTNNGQGLTANLEPIQDGLGNQSPMSLSTQAVNFNRSGPNTFQLDGVPLTVASIDIDEVCGAEPTFARAVAPVIFPQLDIEPPPIDGGIYYNTTTNHLRACAGGVWVTLA